MLGGLVGYAAGQILARQIGHWIFNATIPVQPVLLPLVLGLAVIVTFAGSAGAIRKAMRFDPVFALRGDALKASPRSANTGSKRMACELSPRFPQRPRSQPIPIPAATGRVARE